jgi:hypothetical protein
MSRKKFLSSTKGRFYYVIGQAVSDFWNVRLPIFYNRVQAGKCVEVHSMEEKTFVGFGNGAARIKKTVMGGIIASFPRAFSSSMYVCEPESRPGASLKVYHSTPA